MSDHPEADGPSSDPRGAWWLIAPLVPIAAVTAATPVKVLTKWSMGASLAIGAIAVIALVAIWVRLEPDRSRPSLMRPAVLFAGAAALAGLLTRLLFNPLVWGMANTHYQPDMGSHAVFVHELSKTTDFNPDTYNGFLAFHVLAWWVGKLFRVTVFYAFRGAFYICVLSLPLALGAVVSAALPRRSNPLIALLAFALVGGVITYDLIFPLLHYYQIQASYPQVFAIFFAFLGWALYAAGQSPLQRLLAALFTIGMTRYTYGLNLGDLLAAYMLLALGEIPALPRAWRKGLVIAIAVGLGYGAIVVYRRLWALHTEGGPCCEGLALTPAMWGQLIGALALVIAPALVRLTPAGTRAVRFAAANALAAALIEYAYVSRGVPERYYIDKYPFFGVMMVAAGFIVVAVLAVDQAWSGRGVRAWAVAALLVVTGAIGWSVWKLNSGFAAYRASAAERVWNPPYRTFLPLCNLDAARFIERTLAEEHKSFGGFFSTGIAQTFFTNLEFEGPALAWSPWYNDPEWTPTLTPRPRAGTCFFWDQPASQFAKRGLAHAKKVAEFESDPKTRCTPYRPRWEPPQARSVMCALCE